MSEHSPLPWHVEHENIIIDATGDVVFTDSRGVEDVANTRLIVTAVNAHADLLAAAKESMFIIRAQAGADTLIFGQITNCLCALETAIARAEGTP